MARIVSDKQQQAVIREINSQVAIKNGLMCEKFKLLAGLLRELQNGLQERERKCVRLLVSKRAIEFCTNSNLNCALG